MSAITEVKISYEQEASLPALDRMALHQLGVMESALAEGKMDDARAAGLHLDAIEKRRESLGEAEAMRKRVANERNRLAQPAAPHQQPTVPQVDEGGRRLTRAPGLEFTGNPTWADLKARGHLDNEFTVPAFGVSLKASLRELKTLVLGNSLSSGGAMSLPDYQAGVVDMLQRPRTFLDLLSRVRTSSDTVDWVKQTAFTNAAATVAEATSTTGVSGAKPESALDWVRTNVPIQVIATWIPITTRALADAPMIEDIINGQLMLMLELALEAQVLTGDGSSPNLTGFVNQGILTQALGTDNTMDAILKAAIKIQVSGQLAATDIAMYPTNFQYVRLLRENAATATLGQYLMGPPSLPGPMTIFGLPVTLSQALSAGTAIVGAFNPATHALFDRESANIRTGYINEQFTRNMLTILAELRAGLVVTRPYGFASITGLS
jgi:HK97 family phage major capsid protein